MREQQLAILTQADQLKSEWWSWMQKNPEIFHMYESMALDMIAKGAKHGSSDDILHEIRKQVKHLTKDGSGYKINNNYTPLFARYFVKLYPEHSTFFELRKSKADRPKGQFVPRKSSFVNTSAWNH